MQALVEFKRVVLVGLLFVALGFPVYQKIFAVTRWTERRPAQTQTLSVNRSPTARIPAALAQDSKSIIHFDCRNPVFNSLTTPAQYLRILGQHCKREGVKILVKNHQTNADAELFWMNKSSFSTDLIRLKSGHNDLEMTYQNEEVDRTYRVQVTSAR